MDVVMGAMLAFAALVVLLLLRLAGWCIGDVIANVPLLEPAARTGWLLALIPLFFVAGPAYVLVGPGRNRFTSWMLVRW